MTSSPWGGEDLTDASVVELAEVLNDELLSYELLDPKAWSMPQRGLCLDTLPGAVSTDPTSHHDIHTTTPQTTVPCPTQVPSDTFAPPSLQHHPLLHLRESLQESDRSTTPLEHTEQQEPPSPALNGKILRYHCRYPGCNHHYASTDGVRKHCRKQVSWSPLKTSCAPVPPVAPENVTACNSVLLPISQHREWLYSLGSGVKRFSYEVWFDPAGTTGRQSPDAYQLADITTDILDVREAKVQRGPGHVCVQDARAWW